MNLSNDSFKGFCFMILLNDSFKWFCFMILLHDSFEGFFWGFFCIWGEDQTTKHFFRGANYNSRQIGPESPNPYFYRCKFSWSQNEDLNLNFDGKPRVILKRLLRSRAGRPHWPLHALCVFSGRNSFDQKENPKK